jgi:hypothetical protein
MEPEQKEVVEQVVEQVEEKAPEAPQLSEVEQRALEQGWMPKEKWVEAGKPEEEHRSAKEFIDRTDLYKRIEHLNRDNKELRKAVTDLMDHNRRMDKVAYDRALESLKGAKKQALEDGDADRVIEIDDQLIDLKQAQKNAPAAQPEAPGMPPEFQSWVSRNKWYDTDTELRSDADAAGLAYKRNNIHASPQEVLDYVEKFIRKANPDRFPKKVVPPSPEAGDRAANKPAPRGDVSLNEDETRAMKRFARLGVMTETEYKAQIKAQRERGA